jgi:hypothetical protein
MLINATNVQQSGHSVEFYLVKQWLGKNLFSFINITVYPEGLALRC